MTTRALQGERSAPLEPIASSAETCLHKFLQPFDAPPLLGERAGVRGRLLPATLLTTIHSQPLDRERHSTRAASVPCAANFIVTAERSTPLETIACCAESCLHKSSQPFDAPPLLGERAGV